MEQGVSLKRNSEAGVVLGAIKEERAMPLTPTSDPLAPYSLPPPGPALLLIMMRNRLN